MVDLCAKFTDRVRAQSESGLEATQDGPGLQESFSD